MLGKFFKLIFFIAVIFAVLFAFKTSILRGFGNALIHESKLEKVDALFVLGGNSYDRGKEAIKLYRENIAPVIIASGGNIPPSFRALGITLKEAEVTTKFLIDSGVPAQNIITIATATSTKEEAESFLELCNKKGYSKIMIVSAKMHTGRASRIVEKVFKGTDIQILYRGASTNADFDEQNWWKSEEGLIFVNDEYIKSLYYLMKY